MSKITGLGWTTLSVDNASAVLKDIKNDVTNLDFSTPFNQQEVTGVDQYAVSRLQLLADFSGTLNCVFNPSADRSHAVLGEGDMRVERTLSLGVGGKTLSNEVLLTSYDVTRAAGGELTTASPFALANGVVPTWA